MTDEMKLLRAFIEASGYEVEVSQDRNEIYNVADCINDMPKQNALPTNIIMTTDYKVTKKPASYIKCNKCGTHLAHNSPLNACLCGNSHNLERNNHE